MIRYKKLNILLYKEMSTIINNATTPDRERVAVVSSKDIRPKRNIIIETMKTTASNSHQHSKQRMG